MTDHPVVELSILFDRVAPALSGHFVHGFSWPLVGFEQRGAMHS